MNRLVQQPAGDPGARKHYRDTIENPVNLESISEFLDQDEKDRVQYYKVLQSQCPYIVSIQWFTLVHSGFM